MQQLVMASGRNLTPNLPECPASRTALSTSTSKPAATHPSKVSFLLPPPHCDLDVHQRKRKYPDIPRRSPWRRKTPFTQRNGSIVFQSSSRHRSMGGRLLGLSPKEQRLAHLQKASMKGGPARQRSSRDRPSTGGWRAEFLMIFYVCGSVETCTPDVGAADAA